MVSLYGALSSNIVSHPSPQFYRTKTKEMQNPSATVVIAKIVPAELPGTPLPPVPPVLPLPLPLPVLPPFFEVVVMLPPPPLPAGGRGAPVSYTLRVQTATGLTRLQTPESVAVGAE